MKTLYYLLIIFLCAILHHSLSGQDKSIDLVASQDSTELDGAKEDTTEYELIVMEPGYEAYLVTQPPMNFYSESYYKTWNQQYVTEWNIRYISGPRRELYENEIYYDPMTDYGIELEYRLYYFFRFFEKKYGVKFVPRGR